MPNYDDQKNKRSIRPFYSQVAERISVEHVCKAWCQAKVCGKTCEHVPWITIQEGRDQINAECRSECCQKCSVRPGEKNVELLSSRWSIRKVDALSCT